MNKSVCIACAALGIAACGGDGSTPAVDETGILGIAMTDAAVDGVTEVRVEFTGITLKPQFGEQLEIAFDSPRSIDLFDLQDGRTAALLPDTRVQAGPYNWIRLSVNADFDNVFDSYAMLEDGSQVELRVPSGSQSGLKLVSGFTVTADSATYLVIDWDLRKALSNPVGQPGLHLRPALRVTDMASFGTLAGTVDNALLEDPACSNDLVEDTGNAVYVYAGTVDDPLDIRGEQTDPVATATVRKDVDDVYRYQVAYLSVGQYTAAFTCQASDDDPEAADDIVIAPVVQGVDVVDGETTTVNF